MGQYKSKPLPDARQTLPRQRNVWMNIYDYETLLKTNVDFLRGVIPNTPYHGGHIDAETNALVPSLIELHRRGLLTVSGQPAEMTSDLFVAETWVGRGGEPQGNWYTDVQQKPYLEFFVPKSQASTALVDYLLSSSRFKTVVSDVGSGEGWSNITEQKYNVTRDRHANSLETLKFAPWRLYNGVPASNVGDGVRMFEKYPNLVHIIGNTYHVDVAMTEYGVGDLEGELLALCDAFGLAPVYDVGLSGAGPVASAVQTTLGAN